MRSVRCAAFVLSFTLVLVNASAQRRGSDDYGGAFRGLEKAMKLAQELGLEEDADRLRQVSLNLRRAIGRRESGVDNDDNAERREAQRQLEVLRLAKKAFAEGGKEDALDLIERAMHARELALEGRRDDEAMRIRKREPSREQLLDLLERAAMLWKQYGSEENSRAVADLARRMSRTRRAPPERGRTERDVAEQQLEVMMLARDVLRASGDERLTELMHRVVRGRQARLEGRGDEEAMEIYRRVPSTGNVAELLMHTSQLLRKQGKEDRADIVARLSQEYAERARGERDRDPRERAGDESLDEIRRGIEEMRQVLREIRAELKNKRR